MLKGVRDALATLRNAIDPAVLAAAATVADRSPAKKAMARAAYVDYIRAAATALKAAPVVALIPAVQQQIDVAKLQGAIEHLTLAIDHARAGEYIQSFIELQAAMGAAGVKVPGWFGKYGGFIAEIAAARSKEDVQRVLEAAAAPVGAWRKKRGSGHQTLTLNGYVGVQGGYEWLSGDDSNGSFQGGLFEPRRPASPRSRVLAVTEGATPGSMRKASAFPRQLAAARDNLSWSARRRRSGARK